MHFATAKRGLRLVRSPSRDSGNEPNHLLAQRMEIYYIINYYIKYIELLDTVFLTLKKKPLGLHDYPDG
jgi:GNS1/SUR4 family